MTTVIRLALLLAEHEPQDRQEGADLARIGRLIEAERDDPWLRSSHLHLTASALIVDPASRRVLLRWHQRQQAWLQVGGHADPGEREPLSIALREAAEETGLTDLVPWPDTSLLHAVMVPVPPGRGEPAHEHADLRFVLATGSPDAVRAETADAPLRWLTIAEAAALTSEANLRESLARLGRLPPDGPATCGDSRGRPPAGNGAPASASKDNAGRPE